MSTPRPGPRTLAALVVVLTFIVGWLAGAVVDRGMLQAHRRPPRPAGSAHSRVGWERGRERFVQQLTRELNLNPQQVAQINAITRARQQRMNALWNDVRPRIHALLEETRREIDQVLTPEQRARLQELRRKHEARERIDSGAVRDTGGK